MTNCLVGCGLKDDITITVSLDKAESEDDKAQEETKEPESEGEKEIENTVDISNDTSKEETVSLQENAPKETVAKEKTEVENPVSVYITELENYTERTESFQVYNGNYGEDVTSYIIYTEDEITNFKVLKLSLDSYENDEMILKAETLTDIGRLTDGAGLILKVPFVGDAVPTMGVSYVDTEGNKYTKAIEMSGYDGSIYLSDINVKE